MPEALLSLSGVRAGYDAGDVLFDVSFEVPAGHVVSLIGRNGAGKSTTIKTVVGVVRASAGRIVFDGADIIGLPVDAIARRGVAYVPEERRIFGNLSVEENLRVARRSGVDGSRWTLEKLYAVFPKLAELRRRQGGLLSGGEQQMLCIARALATDPRLLLLDEPSEGLAPIVVESLVAQISGLKAEGLTILLSEQNTAFARALSETALVIDRGAIRFAGDFDSLETWRAAAAPSGTGAIVREHH